MVPSSLHDLRLLIEGPFEIVLFGEFCSNSFLFLVVDVVILLNLFASTVRQTVLFVYALHCPHHEVAGLLLLEALLLSLYAHLSVELSFQFGILSIGLVLCCFFSPAVLFSLL